MAYTAVEVGNEIERNANFPYSVWRINVKHIRVIKPSCSNSLSHSYKSCYISVVLLGLVTQIKRLFSLVKHALEAYHKFGTKMFNVPEWMPTAHRKWSCAMRQSWWWTLQSLRKVTSAFRWKSCHCAQRDFNYCLSRVVGTSNALLMHSLTSGEYFIGQKALMLNQQKIKKVQLRTA
jgi:hypothetical protein